MNVSKKTGLFVACLLSMNMLFSQHKAGTLYDDAARFYQALQKDSDPEQDFANKQVLRSIVSYYFDTIIVSQAEIKNLLTSNWFLKKYADIFSLVDSSIDVSDYKSTATGTGSSALMGLDVTNIADGIAKFLIKRGKQELSIAFFDKFREELKKFPELIYLFPLSSEIVQNIENYNYQTLLQELKDAFTKDLLNMPANLLSLRDITQAACAGDTSCGKRIDIINKAFKNGAGFDSRFLILPLIAMQEMLDGNNIIEIANNLSGDESVCGKNDDLSGVIQLSAILFESFRTDKSDRSIFINQTSLKTLFFSEDMLRIFIGLMYQKYHAMECYKGLTVNTKSFQELLQILLNTKDKFYAKLSSFDKINQAYATMKKRAEDATKTDVGSYISVVAASFTMLSNSVNAVAYLVPQNNLPAKLKQLTDNFSIAASICSDIGQRNYAGIFNTAVKFITENKVMEDKSKEKLVKYLSFAANLATASNSDEVAQAIETVALPPGSYSVKQRSAVSISFNGYVGYGWDVNKGHGVYAPVGFSFSAGLGKKNGGAFTLFTSLIDVGGIVSYRLKDGTTDALKQEIRLESIISPSAQVFFSIPRTPVAFGCGWKMTPKLFYSNQSGFQTVPPTSVFNVSALIDIPIFAIYSRTYKN